MDVQVGDLMLGRDRGGVLELQPVVTVACSHIAIVLEGDPGRAPNGKAVVIADIEPCGWVRVWKYKGTPMSPLYRVESA